MSTHLVTTLCASLKALLVLAVVACAVQGVSPTAALAQASTAAGANDKVDVTDLEKKYWASKDTDFSVVQNRLYTKANRLALSLQYGTLINDPWSDGPTYSGSLGYYFSERFGIEGHYQKTNSVDNKAASNLKTQQSGQPNHAKIIGFQGLSANWVPFYAKMSVLNGTIIYFDMAISPGIGITTYEQQREIGNISKTAPTLSLDVTQSFFFSKYAAFRVDYKNRWFQEEMVRYRIPNASMNTETAQTSMLLFGFTFYY